MSGSLLDVASVRDYLARHILVSVPMEERRIALTFDDGPHPRHTPLLLDMLGRKRIHATFFVVGRWIRRFPDVLERCVQEGHEVGNHTDMHLPLTLLPPTVIRREIRTAEHLIMETGRQRPRFLRPPMGWFNRRILGIARDLDYVPVIGSIHPRDSNKPGVDSITDHVLDRAAPGAIIILHDGGWRVGVDRMQTVEAADRITDELLARGYRFETLSALAEGAGKVA